jgi:hypothetical protein
MKKLIVAIKIIEVIINKDFIFIISLDNTIHLGMNPSKGGIPAIERIKIVV